MIGDVPVVAIADGQQVHVLADRCSHLSGPLSGGEVGDGWLTCPWHGSTFRISDGSVVHGPATTPQPVFENPRPPRGGAGLPTGRGLIRVSAEFP